MLHVALPPLDAVVGGASPPALVLKGALAVVLGGMIGLERELGAKPAGLRTNILICVGAMMLMDLSMAVSTGPNGEHLGDPGRIAAQVVTGIGFLGAGAIVQLRGAILGLTTAATIWVVCAIGLTVGAGRYVEATGMTVLVLVVLVGLGRAERLISARRRPGVLVIRTTTSTPFEAIEEAFRATGVRVVGHRARQGATVTTHAIDLLGSAREVDELSHTLSGMDGVLGVRRQ